MEKIILAGLIATCKIAQGELKRGGEEKKTSGSRGSFLAKKGRSADQSVG